MRPVLFAAMLVAASCDSGAIPTTAIVGATLLNPGQPPLVPSIVVVRGSRIVRAGSQGATPLPAGSEKIDATGKFLVPAPGAGSSIQAGEPASLLILDANPGEKPGTLASPARIMKEGEWVR